MNTIKDRLSTLIFYLSILFFIIGFNFSDTPTGGWMQQFMPDLHGAQIKDITFTDSLTGYAVTGLDSFNTARILKTTNGGDNWFNSLTDSTGFTKVIFLNNDTGFTGRLANPPNYDRIIKTTNGGINWFTLNTPTDINPIDMSVISKDSIWIADDITLVGGIYRTINGGASWIKQYGGLGSNPFKIYMFNGRIGFMANNASLYKTTNSGENWFSISGGGFSDIYFIDSLTGWKTNAGNIQKTTDGGLNWAIQTLPSGGNITWGMLNFSVLNRDTIWGSGGFVSYGGDKFSGILYRTTNGGNKWLYQIPDTSFDITGFYGVQFLHKNIGWGFGQKRLPNSQVITYGNIHTTNGGDTTFYTDIQEISSKIPEQFKLYQNYPNPFNPRTIIKYQIVNSKEQISNVKLAVYDIQGREIVTLVNEKQDYGNYQVDFSGNGLSSGVYFYKIIITSGKEVFRDTRKMVLIK